MSQQSARTDRQKAVTRLFVECDLAAGTAITLIAAQSHLLTNVLRAKSGEQILIFNGRDGEFRASIEKLDKKSTTIRVDHQSRAQSMGPDLWLLVAPIKRASFDLVVQKAAELGVSQIHPVITRRTNVERTNADRMRSILIEAAEQCERLTVPTIAAPQKLETALENWPATRQLMFCDEGEEANPILKSLSGRERGPWAILTGPEGGFDEDERALLRKQSFVIPVSLGPRILRAETAAIAAIALWQAALGDGA